MSEGVASEKRGINYGHLDPWYYHLREAVGHTLVHEYEAANANTAIAAVHALVMLGDRLAEVGMRLAERP